MVAFKGIPHHITTSKELSRFLAIMLYFKARRGLCSILELVQYRK